MTSGLCVDQLSVAYDERVVVHDVSLQVPDGGLTAIIGPNACGKSTLLRTMARLLNPRGGSVLLDGTDLHRLPTRDVARRLGLLPQAQTLPQGLRVKDLVARGRFPHQTFLRRWTEADERAVEAALGSCGLDGLRERLVDELSGGQRQRAWLATVLAQDPQIVLLDEPTTYLDLPHQLDVLDLCALMRAEGRTVVAVLHDINLAARYATHMIAMRDGRIVASGHPDEVVTQEVMRETFQLDCRVIPDPETGTPMLIPARRPAHAPTTTQQEAVL